MKNILVDTNVILDMVQKREPFSKDAAEIIASCITKKNKGYVTAHSLCDLFFILRKDIDVQGRMQLIKLLCSHFGILSETKNDFIAVTDNNALKDLEDGLQMQCSLAAGLDYIVTRNISDFSISKVPAITPSNFLKI